MIQIVGPEMGQLTGIESWARQLSTLTRIAWTGRDGKCYFPYLPLTGEEYWRREIRRQWEEGNLLSWVMVSGGEIVAHAALVKKPGGWELGRWVALSTAPKGAMSLLVGEALRFARERWWGVWVECTQAHTASQKICLRAGLRFAGIGILSKIGEVWWDILYFDNLPAGNPFSPRPGVIGDPLGREVPVEPAHLERLGMIPGLITTERGGDLPPRRFHVLREIEPMVRLTIKLNLPA